MNINFSLNWKKIKQEVDGVDYILRQLYTIRFLMSFHERIPRRIKNNINNIIKEIEKTS